MLKLASFLNGLKKHLTLEDDTEKSLHEKEEATRPRKPSMVELGAIVSAIRPDFLFNLRLQDISHLYMTNKKQDVVLLPASTDFTPRTVRKLISSFESGHLLNAQYVRQILQDSKSHLEKQPNVVKLTLRQSEEKGNGKHLPRLTVVGDLHGRYSIVSVSLSGP